MTKENQIKRLFQIGIIAAFATLAFVGTTLIRIPIPASAGYFNLGDTFVMIAALLYGPWVGAMVGLIGPAMADAIGFPQFILATGIIKCMEGFAIGFIGANAPAQAFYRPLLAVIVGIVILVGGYFIFEAVIYPWLAKLIPFFAVTDVNAAIAEIAPNALQGVLSAIIALGIRRLFKHRDS